MAQNLIFWPVLAQVALTISVLLLLGPARARSMRERRQSLDDMVVAQAADWDHRSLKISNNFKNQFELPVLFYAACAFALMTRSVDAVVLGTAWLFVLCRVLHAAFHIGSDRVLYRGTAYLVGLAALVVQWLWLAAILARQGA